MNKMPESKFEQQSRRFIEEIEAEREGVKTSDSFLSEEDAKAFQQVSDVWDAADLLSESDVDELLSLDDSLPEFELSEDTSHDEAWYQKIIPNRGLVYSLGLAILLVAVSVNNYFGTSTDYFVAKGRTNSVLFSDGSELLASGNSKFTIQEGWGTRKVFMEYGNVFFSVAPNRRKPFLVETPNSTVEVIGTAFNVFSVNDHDEVIVEHGRVSVESSDKTSHQLKAQDKLVIDNDRVELFSGIDVQTETSWREGVISFDNESLENVIKKMNDFYIHSIIIETDSLRTQKVSGSFSTNNIDDFIAALKSLLDVEVSRRSKGEIIIR